jgi:putative sterol carrier protein
MPQHHEKRSPAMPDAETLAAALRARADLLRGLGYRVRFDITDSDACVLLDGTGVEPVIEAASPETEADTVLRLSGADLEKLIAGRLSPMLAFSTGRLRVGGSKGVAMKLASMLDEA